MITHLVLSTVVLLCVLVAARLLPLTARTRHTLLFLGVLKFAVPDQAVVAAIRWLGIDLVTISRNVVPETLRVLGGTTVTPIPTTAGQINWLVVSWAGVAVLIFGRWALLRVRTERAISRHAAAPAPRELEILTDVMRELQLRTAVDLVRSPVSEAPAVARVIRPIIVLPQAGCDDLDDAELRALLLHECAHVRRHDNVLGIVEALALSLLWFNPVVHLALRQLAAAREEACDEAAVDGTRAGTYLDALAKICRTAIAPRTAGASCMATARIKERMEHLMRYETLKRSAFSHRAVVTTTLLAAIVLIPLTTAFATDTAEVARASVYSLRFDVVPTGERMTFAIQVHNTESGKLVASPTLRAGFNEWASTRSGEGDRDLFIRARGQRDGTAEVELEVKDGGGMVYRNRYTYTPPAAAPTAGNKWNGEPITLQLKDAQLGDVLRTYGQITGLEFVVDPKVADLRITVDFQNVPWDESLDIIARQNGLTMNVEPGRVVVKKSS